MMSRYYEKKFCHHPTLSKKWGFWWHLEVPNAVVQLADVHCSRRYVECQRHKLLGGTGKFPKLDSLKYNFLRSLHQNWVTRKVF